MLHRLILRLAPGVGLLLGAVACSDSKPSEAVARDYFAQSIKQGNATRLRLTDFAKTDGRPGEVMGVKTYSLMFHAEAEFDSAAMFMAGQTLSNDAATITVTPFHRRAASFSWNDAFVDLQGLRPAMPGDRLRAEGVIEFEKRESGWQPTGLRFNVVHDSSKRAAVTDAVPTRNVSQNAVFPGNNEPAAGDTAKALAEWSFPLTLEDETSVRDQKLTLTQTSVAVATSMALSVPSAIGSGDAPTSGHTEPPSRMSLSFKDVKGVKCDLAATLFVEARPGLASLTVWVNQEKEDEKRRLREVCERINTAYSESRRRSN